MGEAFLNKGFRLNIKFVARMLRPYKIRDFNPEITKKGLCAIALSTVAAAVFAGITAGVLMRRLRQ